MKKRNCVKVVAISLTVLLIGILAGCSNSSNQHSDMGQNESALMSAGTVDVNEDSQVSNMERMNTTEIGDTIQEPVEVSDVTRRKRIRTVNMTVETKEFDDLLNHLDQQISDLGGYVESRSTYHGSAYYENSYNRRASLSARVPSGELDTFLNTVAGIGNVVSIEEREEDVTLNYVDLESHKDALRTEQDRLMELMEKAETVEDLIAIESRLSEVRYQIESMESQLRTYDNKVDYSTVYLEVAEVKDLTPASGRTVWQQITQGFMESVKGIGYGLRDIFIWVVVNLPYLLLCGAAAAVVAWIFRKRLFRKSSHLNERSKEHKDLEK